MLQGIIAAKKPLENAFTVLQDAVQNIPREEYVVHVDE